jgi:hypothetical protein
MARGALLASASFVAPGSNPAAIRQQSGSNPAEIQQKSSRNPTEIQPCSCGGRSRSNASRDGKSHVVDAVTPASAAGRR